MKLSRSEIITLVTAIKENISSRRLFVCTRSMCPIANNELSIKEIGHYIQGTNEDLKRITELYTELVSKGAKNE